MWRQGDVFLARVDAIPPDARPKHHTILAEGEATGHSHRVADVQTCRLYQHGNNLYLRVMAVEATVVHDEHGPITIPRGDYRVWRQREYTPQAIRIVMD